MTTNPESSHDRYANLQPLESFASPCKEQYQSPLFGVLPGEIRELVYSYVFADYEDMSRAYDFDTCYRRPDYMAPRKTDTSLLVTCQTIYNEAWYLPWTQAQHTFFLAQSGRKPDKTTEPRQMQHKCAMIERLHPDIPAHRKTISQIQIFAQLCEIENGQIDRILNIPKFMPRVVTITLRHTDIWFWESDNPIFMRSKWVSRSTMPSSVILVRMQVESVERRKEQVDHITDRIRKEWFWRRADGTHLVASCSEDNYADRWTGSSIWQNKRWLRDENDNEPERIRYHIVTVPFRPVNDSTEESSGLREAYKFEDLNVPKEIADRTTIRTGRSFLETWQLAAAGIPPHTSATETYRLSATETWRLFSQHNRRGVRRCGTGLPRPPRR